MQLKRIIPTLMFILSVHACDSCVGGTNKNLGDDVLVEELNGEEILSTSGDTEENFEQSKKTTATTTKSKIKPELSSLINKIASLVDGESEYTREYLEILKVASHRRSLQGFNFFGKNWATKNENLRKGFEKGEYLGVLPKPKEFFEKHGNIKELINRVSDFEHAFPYIRPRLESGELGEVDAINYLNRFTDYTIAVFMLNAMLQTKSENGELRYVKDVMNEDNQKRYICRGTANTLKKKFERFNEKFEGFLEPTFIHMCERATLPSLINCRDELKKLPALIGGQIEPETFNPKEDPFVYKLGLAPMSILWTWINSKELRDGSWDSVFGFASEEKRITNIMRDLMFMNREYLAIIDSIEEILKRNSSHSLAEEQTLKLFEEKVNNTSFLETQKRGEEAISNLRKILSTKRLYDIGRKQKTICLAFVGLGTNSDPSRINSDEAKKLLSALDILSSLSVLMESKLEVKSSLRASTIERIIRNGLSKGEAYYKSLYDLNDELWVMESVEEQREREDVANRRFSLFTTATWISLGIFSTFFPAALPVVLTILLIGALVVNHISTG